MYCPQCLTEYREGSQRCSDCDVLLNPGPPPKSAEDLYTPLEPVDPATLITVAELNDSLALTLAQAALEDAGIEYAVRGEDPRHGEVFEMHRVGTPMWKCHCWILVAPECAERARVLLEPLENPEPLKEDVDPER